MGRSTPPAHNKADAGVSHGGGAIREISWKGDFHGCRIQRRLGGSGISVELKISNLSLVLFFSPP